MTGTGTKLDPFVISTWPELTQTVVQSDVYIELASDIDCGLLSPITVTTQGGEGVYNMNCAELNGKGYAIKNAYFLNCSSIFGGVRNNTIKNLKFKNIYLSHSSLFRFKSDHPTYYILPTLIDCDFSIEAVNESTVFSTDTTYLYAAVFRRCSLYVHGTNDAYLMSQNGFADDRVPILFDDCVVELGGEFKIILSAQLVNTHLFGEVTVSHADDAEYYPCLRVYNKGSYGYYTSEFMRSNSIIDLTIHNNTGEQLYAYIDSDTYRDDSGDYHYEIDSLFVNTEVLENFAYSATGGASEFKRCTTSQIHDETYLRGQGFNVERTWDNRYVEKSALVCSPYNYVANQGCYIDTGIINTRYRKTLVQWEYNEVQAERWVAGGVDTNFNGGCMMGTSDGTTVYDGSFGEPSANIRNDFSRSFAGTKIESVSTGGGTDSYQNTYNFIINGRNINGGANRGIDGKIYAVKIWETDNSLLRNYVPAYDTVNQVHGMYDTVNNVFYGSATAVPFPGTEPTAFRFVNGVLDHNLMSKLHRLGAFAGSGSLVRVTIPPTVKKIGRYAFRNTQLQKVKIASDCTYYDTSFPSGCVIEHY